MAIEPTLHGLVADQVYVMFQSLLNGKEHPQHDTARKMAKEFCDNHQAEMIQRGNDAQPQHHQHKRAS